MFQRGECTQLCSKESAAGHLTTVWLAEFCNRKTKRKKEKQKYRNVDSSFMQTLGKITVYMNKEKVMK
jgi:hypothetical protein